MSGFKPNPQLTKDIQAGIGVDKYLDNKFYVGNEETSPSGMYITNDGSNMYICGESGDSVVQYSLTVPYSIQSAVYTTKEFNPAEMSNIESVSVNSTGDKLYLLGGSVLYQYTLGTQFDIATASYDSKSYNFSTQTSYPYGFDMTEDGTILLMTGNTGIVYKYIITTPYDISTAIADSSFDILNCSDSKDVCMSQNGSDMYILRQLDASGLLLLSIVQYTLSTQYDITTAVYKCEMSLPIYPEELNIVGGDNLHILTRNGDFIQEFNLSTPYDISTAVYGLPANSPQQPILYLPMKDAETAHINEGTGGDFVQNGLIETADVGANQLQCKASEFDGVDDDLSLAGTFANSKYITISTIVNRNTLGTVDTICTISNGRIRYRFLADNTLRLDLTSPGGSSTVTKIYSAEPSGKNIAIAFSYNGDTGNLVTSINGVVSSSTETLITVGLGDFTGHSIGSYFGGDLMGGSIGELYFETKYYDLSTFNPFYDLETNKPIPVRKAMETLGSNPLICMPIDASAPHINYGSGGDFVLNGGGLQGSRGASEYIGRTIVSDASNKVTGSIFCKSLVKWINNVPTYLNDVTLTETDAGTVGYYFGFSDIINWALESNKNLVTNQLGYPRQPSQVISDSGWTPVLGLFFEDSSNFGLNSYGADYSVIGSPVSGADVKV